MYEPIQTLSGVTSLLCAALSTWMVLNPRVHEGFVIKTGLVLMATGLMASGVITLKGFDTLHGLWNASLLLRFGLLVVLLGYTWRMDFQKKGMK